MSSVTVVYALLFYAATAILIVGLGYKIIQYWQTPQPLKIPVTPAPMSGSGVVSRMFSEVVFFKSLFKSNKWIWIFGWVFHAALAVALLRHFRYFTEPVWGWVVLVQPFGVYAGFAMMLGLAGLLVRRIVVPRVRYITSPSDILFLVMLLSIGASGLSMKYVAPTDIIALKAFVLGLIYFDWQPLPTDVNLLIHLGLVIALMIVFPFSKLLHAPGLFFSPARNQADDVRMKRHPGAYEAQNEARGS
jgi:nitrate reductase gamma subunit